MWQIEIIGPFLPIKGAIKYPKHVDLIKYRQFFWCVLEVKQEKMLFDIYYYFMNIYGKVLPASLELSELL